MGSGVPAVRFKDEFGIVFPDWEKKPLREIASPVKQKNRDVSVKNVLTNSATRGIINQRDYFDKDVANSKNLGGYYVVHMDDFVYNPRISEQAPVGPIKRNHLHTGVMSPLYTVFRVKEGHRTFFEFYFQTKIWHRYMNSVANFGARHDRMAIATADFYNLPMPIPSYKERNKIVEFLTVVDGRIQQLIQKKALLEDYKKGVMQQLFTQAIRFKDDHGNDFPDWEEKKLGEIGSFSKGKGISKAEISEGGATPCVRYGELYTEYSELIQVAKSKTDVPTDELVLSTGNDVIIPASGETHIDIATASCVMSDGIALGGDLNIIRSKLNGVFLAYYLNNACKHAIASVAQGSSVIHLYPDHLKTLSLSFPSHDEQAKIADFLSGIDRKIESVASQVTDTQTFKKGLLQQMFI